MMSEIPTPNCCTKGSASSTPVVAQKSTPSSSLTMAATRQYSSQDSQDKEEDDDREMPFISEVVGDKIYPFVESVLGFFGLG